MGQSILQLVVVINVVEREGFNMTNCPGCGLEGANFYYDGSEYYCEDCYLKMKEEECQEWKEEHGTN